MARTPAAVVKGNRLTIANEAPLNFIEVGSDEWYKWLQTADSFTFCSESGEFTARRERFQRGSTYWKAYRYHQSKLYQTYLGKDQDVGVEKLQQAAIKLASRINTEPGSEKIAATANLPLETETIASTTATPIASSTPSANAATTIFLTKVQKPVVTRQLVSRTELSQRLTQIEHSRLTLISAPPGSGKTTLVLWWLEETGLPAAWHSLDQEDNEPGRFWQYFVQSLEKVRPGIANSLAHLLQPFDLRQLISALVNEFAIVPQKLVVVLDDYHVISSKEIHEGLELFLERLPVGWHIVITSRTDPPWALGRLRARGELQELRAGDLRFNLAETGVFLREIMGLELSDIDVAALHQRTEGWVTGLQLAALGMRGHTNPAAFVNSFKGSNRFVLDYLAEEVLERQNEKVRNFLLQTSILKQMNAELVEAITGYESGQAFLSELEQANLFLIPLDAERHWYRYHHLFGDYLRSRLLHEQADHVQLLYRWAGQWYEEHAMFHEAIDYFLLAHDFETAARLIDDLARPTAQQGHWKTLSRWLESLPPDLVASNPRTSLNYAWVHVTGERLEEAEKYLNITQALLKEAITGDAMTLEQAALAGEVAAVQTRLAAKLGQRPQLIQFAEEALALLPATEYHFRSIVTWTVAMTQMVTGDLIAASQSFSNAENLARKGNNPVIALAANLSLGEIQWHKGQLRQVAQTYRRALATREWQSVPFIGAIEIALANILYEWNELEEALVHLERGVELLKPGDNIYNQLQGYTLLAATRQAQGDLAAAHEALEQARQVVQQTEWIDSICLVERAEVRYWLAIGDVVAAGNWATICTANPAGKSELMQEYDNLLVVRVYMMLNQLEAAQQLLPLVLAKAEAAGRSRNVLEALLLQAIVFYQQNRLDHAFEKLNAVLAMSEPEGFVRLFLNEGEKLANLLEIYLTNVPSNYDEHLNSYVKKLLAYFKKSDESDLVPQVAIARKINNGTNNGDVDKLLEPLTNREKQVLRLLAAGLSSVEIAAEISVAVSTARSHIKNIYGKLEAQNRVQALARARQLQLLY